LAARGKVANPYFLASRNIAEAKPFTHRDQDIYLVSRLDAFTPEEAISLVVKGAAPSRDGRVVLDQRDALVNRTGEDWMGSAAENLTKQGFGSRVTLETTPKAGPRHLAGESATSRGAPPTRRTASES
jgi:hypothetical protein